MRRPMLALALAAAAFLVAACSSSAPGWTFAPPTPAPAVTPAPSSAPGEPTPVPGGETEAPTDGGSTAGGLKVAALNVAFDLTELTAPADTAFVIDFDNQDAGIPHNVEIKDAMGMSIFMGELVTGPIVTQYEVQALPAGDYVFVCTVHPNMVGNLKVGG